MKRTALIALACLLLLPLLTLANQGLFPKKSETIVHGTLYYQDGRFAGWPANHGIWIWENEILVGFVEAEHSDRPGHTYNPETARNKYARSFDGGETWTITDAYDLGQTGRGYDNAIEPEKARVPQILERSMGDFTQSGFIFTLLRHDNSFGPSHFYYSDNKGHQWQGPYLLPNLQTNGIASRTDYLIDGAGEMSLFVTAAKDNQREGRIGLIRTRNGGVDWQWVSWIGPEPEGFDIMSSSVRLEENTLLTLIRSRRADRHDYISAYYSADNGESWERLRNPVEDTGQGGSPPALLKMKDGRLALAYIYRSEYGSRVNLRFSNDQGRSWSPEVVVRCGDGATRDAGYPRMVQRPDGKLVIVYYWNHARMKGSPPYRYIATTTVDPSEWTY